MASCAVLAGCGSGRQEFRPTENVGGRTVEGFKEAFYDLASEEQKLGAVKVWSRGAYKEEQQGRQMTFITVGFTIENTGQTPITIDSERVQLESVQTEDQILQNVQSIGAARAITAAPQTVSDVEVTFALPSGIEPADVQAFRVRWTTEANGESFTEFTPFVQQRERYAYVPVYSYYNPYYPFDYPYYSPFDFPPRRIIIVRPYPRRVIIRGSTTR